MTKKTVFQSENIFSKYITKKGITFIFLLFLLYRITFRNQETTQNQETIVNNVINIDTFTPTSKSSFHGKEYQVTTKDVRKQVVTLDGILYDGSENKSLSVTLPNSQVKELKVYGENNILKISQDSEIDNFAYFFESSTNNNNPTLYNVLPESGNGRYKITYNETEFNNKLIGAPLFLKNTSLTKEGPYLVRELQFSDVISSEKIYYKKDDGDFKVNYIVKGESTFTITTTTGTFEANEVITGDSSGATATIVTATSATELVVFNVAGTFDADEKITGGTSNAEGTFKSNSAPPSGKIIEINNNIIALNEITGTFTPKMKISSYDSDTSKGKGSIADSVLNITTVNNSFSENKIVTGESTFTITTTTGTFEAGEVITGGTSNATATIVTATSATELVVFNVGGTFDADETITGGTSNAEGTFKSTTTPPSATIIHSYYITSNTYSLSVNNLSGTFTPGMRISDNNTSNQVLGSYTSSSSSVDKISKVTGIKIGNFQNESVTFSDFSSQSSGTKNMYRAITSITNESNNYSKKEAVVFNLSIGNNKLGDELVFYIPYRTYFDGPVFFKGLIHFTCGSPDDLTDDEQAAGITGLFDCDRWGSTQSKYIAVTSKAINLDYFTYPLVCYYNGNHWVAGDPC